MYGLKCTYPKVCEMGGYMGEDSKSLHLEINRCNIKKKTKP